MGYTKTYYVKSRLDKVLSNVCNENKTNNGLYIYSENCQYQIAEYVIATHVDTDCIHNHMVINSVNMVNGKSFSREHDRKAFPAWKKLRQISDRICAERGLSVIQTDKGKGMTSEDWKKVENALSSPYGRVDFKIDGYEVTIMCVMEKPLHYT